MLQVMPVKVPPDSLAAIREAVRYHGVPGVPEQAFAHTFWTRTSTGDHLHRCEVCWPDSGMIDNGFVLVEEPVAHMSWCPFAGVF